MERNVRINQVVNILVNMAEQTYRDGMATDHELYRYQELGTLSGFRLCLGLLGAATEADKVGQLWDTLHAQQ